MVEARQLKEKIDSILYNYEGGILRVAFKPEAAMDDRILTLQADGMCIAARAEPWGGNAMAVFFREVFLTDLSQLCCLVDIKPSAVDVFEFRPSDCDLKYVPRSSPPEGKSYLLASFPRSGSNFLQNVVRQSLTDMRCASIYAGGRLSDRDAFLKSHNLNDAGVGHELKELWASKSRFAARIVLVRDPRDMFLSGYDYVCNRLGQTVPPDQFLATDYFLGFFDAERGRIARYKRFKTVNIIQAYRQWLRYWMGQQVANGQGRLVRFEDLVLTSGDGFKTVFDALDRSMPEELKGIESLQSQYGSSERPRGQAGGWRTAPDKYAPIIEAVNTRLRSEIDALGYSIEV
ncbi:hypothetical protein RMQ97_00160 [Maricaulis sp. D1M11]|uniref:hypothetical protein n=1 Tax=Maricaulis sp. D1M11 TaxID=3076117 RepID=UPI0039B57662